MTRTVTSRASPARVASVRRRLGSPPVRKGHVMRIFIAGATGVIGRRIARLLLTDGHRVQRGS